MKKTFLSLATLFILSLSAQAQDFTMPVASYKTTVSQQFSTSKIEIEYSRPSMKGRTIFGEMVKYGEPWRTGANSITKITFNEEIYFGETLVKPGTYALYTIPDKESWLVILNSNYKSSGLTDIKPENDIAVTKVKSTHINERFETFTIDLNNLTNTEANLNIIWENTLVSVPLKADNHKRIINYLEKELKGKNPPYREASYYFFESGYNYDLALEYANKVLEQNPKAFWIESHKAKIFTKLGNKEEAVKAAERAYKLTEGGKYEAEYKQKFEELKN